jgi:hypothetical protein
MAFRREKKSEYITLTLVTKLASPWQEDITIKHWTKVWVVCAPAIFQLLINFRSHLKQHHRTTLYATTNTPLTQQNQPSSPSLVRHCLSTTPSLILTTSTEQKTIHSPVGRSHNPSYNTTTIISITYYHRINLLLHTTTTTIEPHILSFSRDSPDLYSTARPHTTDLTAHLNH